jgi:hypothetical protein
VTEKSYPGGGYISIFFEADTTLVVRIIYNHGPQNIQEWQAERVRRNISLWHDSNRGGSSLLKHSDIV